ncbi:MAG TPA: DUF721 domain-containing protein [Acidimicrobiia bacterium]|nr:DUF721 domain-containing protein [Acidimicrobiia bacterium]
MIPLDQAIEATLEKLGLRQPVMMMELSREWDEFAGSPWAGVSRPLYLQRGVLFVEVLSPPALGFLRYGVGDLERRLAEKFGSDNVRSVELRAAPRRPGKVF